jgi:tripartite-type tricarboxylate transporter receptor subunit TctC
MTLWFGLLVPKSTPEHVVAWLNHAAVEALNGPAVRKKFEDLSLQMPRADQLSPAALGSGQKVEIANGGP